MASRSLPTPDTRVALRLVGVRTPGVKPKDSEYITSSRAAFFFAWFIGVRYKQPLESVETLSVLKLNCHW
jgi:hypothetical protein